MNKPSHQARSCSGYGATLFLSVNPGRDSTASSIDIEQIQEAVVSVARAVFSRGGTLAMAGNCPLLSLVLAVATEYWERHATADLPAGEIRRPLIRLFPERNRDAEDDGWQDTGIISIDEWDLLPQAVKALVEQTHPAGMLCLGGDGEVFEQAAIFRRLAPEAPIAVVAAIGGDAESIQAEFNAQAEDHELMRKLRGLRGSPASRDPEERVASNREADDAIPYPLLTQRLVDRLFG